MSELIAWLLFMMAISGPRGFAAVAWLVRCVRWYDMTILGMDYQTFWLSAGCVWAVLKIAELIIEAEKASALNGIHDELKRLKGASCQRMAVNGLLERIERIDGGER